MICSGSNTHVTVSTGQLRHTGGAVRANQATNVSCPHCGRRFATARMVYTDHGIPMLGGRARIPRHNAEARS